MGRETLANRNNRYKWKSPRPRNSTLVVFMVGLTEDYTLAVNDIGVDSQVVQCEQWLRQRFEIAHILPTQQVVCESELPFEVKFVNVVTAINLDTSLYCTYTWEHLAKC